MCRVIQLTQGYITVVDEADYTILNAWKWHAQVVHRKDGSISKVYATRGDYSTDYHHPKRIMMHRFILGIDNPAIEVDHKDHSGLNNQRSNLRTCNSSQNQQNCRKPNSNSSGYKGVRKHGPSWIARIFFNGKQRNLGCYPTPIEAAKAYNQAAIELFGEFANLNSIIGG